MDKFHILGEKYLTDKYFVYIHRIDIKHHYIKSYNYYANVVFVGNYKVDKFCSWTFNWEFAISHWLEIFVSCYKKIL